MLCILSEAYSRLINVCFARWPGGVASNVVPLHWGTHTPPVVQAASAGRLSASHSALRKNGRRDQQCRWSRAGGWERPSQSWGSVGLIGLRLASGCVCPARLASLRAVRSSPSKRATSSSGRAGSDCVASLHFWCLLTSPRCSSTLRRV